MEDQPVALDFASLRQQAISQLEQMSGAWTDFNLHDPGITIMEALCYALTDLVYRASYSIPDILSDGGNDAYESIHLAPEILSCNPVTLCDLRRLVLDVEGVKNVWIEPVQPAVDFYFHPGKQQLQLDPDPPSTQPVAMRGLYRVMIETSDIAGIDGSVVRRNAALRLHKNRGLCEDFDAVHVLEPQMIQVQIAVEIGPVEDAPDLLVRILQAIDGQLSPSVPVVGLRALLDSGKAVDEVYEGPLLHHGFISPESIRLGDRPTSINTSDIIHAVMDVQGVRAVRSVTLTSGEQTEAWSLPVDTQKIPRLDVTGSTFLLEREGIVAAVDFSAVIATYRKKQLENEALNRSDNGEDPLVPPAGRDRRIGNYYSMQHHLPPAYGVGEMGLPESATDERKARAKQLKAYLMMFDQLLANEFAQLSHVKDLFSFRDDGTRTYFSQVVDDDSLHLDDIRATDIATHQANVDAITEDPARGLDAQEPVLEPSPCSLFGAVHRTIRWCFRRPCRLHGSLRLLGWSAIKQAFLRRYPRMSSARGSAIDYLEPLGPDNLSGLEERVSLRLGLGFGRTIHFGGAHPPPPHGGR